ncbi:hypothetical protein BGX31_008176 [Mortierella sp. GBA43]|nr:hypothetical protein BGX31_008176 [Mortierella sp. GBA43]
MDGDNVGARDVMFKPGSTPGVAAIFARAGADMGATTMVVSDIGAAPDGAGPLAPEGTAPTNVVVVATVGMSEDTGSVVVGIATDMESDNVGTALDDEGAGFAEGNVSVVNVGTGFADVTEDTAGSVVNVGTGFADVTEGTAGSVVKVGTTFVVDVNEPVMDVGDGAMTEDTKSVVNVGVNEDVKSVTEADKVGTNVDKESVKVGESESEKDVDVGKDDMVGVGMMVSVGVGVSFIGYLDGS